jgi:uncharacterized membrane protein
MSTRLPTFRRALLTGLLALAPVGLTLWVFVTLFRWIDGWIQPLLRRAPFLHEVLPPEGLTGIGFLTALLIVLAVGFFANNLLGRWLFGWIDRTLARIPWIKPVYGTAKDLSGVVFGGQSKAFREVVLFEYPRKGIYSVGFVTQEIGVEPAADADSGYYNVFLPTTPNPTSGFLLMLPRRDVIPLGIPIEDGLKLVISGGSILSQANRRQLNESLTRLRALS